MLLPSRAGGALPESEFCRCRRERRPRCCVLCHLQPASCNMALFVCVFMPLCRPGRCGRWKTRSSLGPSSRRCCMRATLRPNPPCCCWDSTPRVSVLPAHVCLHLVGLLCLFLFQSPTAARVPDVCMCPCLCRWWSRRASTTTVTCVVSQARPPSSSSSWARTTLACT